MLRIITVTIACFILFVFTGVHAQSYLQLDLNFTPATEGGDGTVTKNPDGSLVLRNLTPGTKGGGYLIIAADGTLARSGSTGSGNLVIPFQWLPRSGGTLIASGLDHPYRIVRTSATASNLRKDEEKPPERKPASQSSNLFVGE